MRKRLALILLLVATCLVAFLPSEAAACGPRPLTDYTISTQDYTFVMLLPDDPKKYPIRSKELRAKYSSSGMYKNDATNTLLWKVDWYADWYPTTKNVAMSVDGQYVVRIGDNIDGDAIFFYSAGQEVKKYTTSSLGVTSDKVQRGPCGYPSIVKKYEFDDTNRRFTVETALGDKYVFRLDGELIEGSLQVDAGPPIAWFFIVIISLLLGLLVVSLIRGRFGKDRI